MLTAGLQEDFGALIVSVILCTTAVGLIVFAILGRSARYREVLYAGLFAALYGLRLASNTAWADLFIGQPLWLQHVRAALEYLVPIPGALLFFRTFQGSWSLLNRGIVVLFIVLAALAIPYEIAMASPFAIKQVVDVLVVLLVGLFSFNLLFPGGTPNDDRRVFRWATFVFCLFVINEHFPIVDAPWGLAEEPVGFLIFLGGIVFITLRRVVGDQLNLIEVKSELSTARKIQMSIIPRSAPEAPGLMIETFYRPASDVGGDFYDFLDTGDGRIGVLVADVSGHGVPAALLASMLKVALANQIDSANDPPRLLSNLNRQFVGKLERQFITAVYVSIDTTSWQVKVATAGHPPPLLRSAQDGSIREVTSSGPILGRFRIAEFTEANLAMEAGDCLVLYTDGLTETRNRLEEPWGEQRLQQTLGGDGVPTVEQTFRAAVEFTGHDRFEDDVTMLVVRREGSF